MLSTTAPDAYPSPRRVQAEPSWGMLDIFVVKRLQSVMALDALRSSHPVSVPIPDPAKINQIFDIITYDKGNAGSGQLWRASASLSI